MKACPRWKEAIAGCALGETPEPDLAAHLAVCPPCENALREGRAMAALIDLTLHRRAAVEPPVYGPERVMARIHGRSDTRGWWRWATVAAAVLMVIAMWMRRPAPEAGVAALSKWRSPTEALLRPPVAAAWATTPRLGEGFFNIQASGEIHAK